MGRCYRENDNGFKSYGAKGIRVHSEWIKDKRTFEIWFLKQVKKLGLTEEEFIKNSSRYHVDRIDTDGHYTPENCRVVTAQANQRNKKNRVVKKVISAEGEVLIL